MSGAPINEYAQQRRYSFRLASSSSSTCSYCNKAYPNLQALGGHLTAHRKEIEVMRRRYDEESTQNKRRSSARLVARRMGAMAAEEVERNLNLELTLAVGGGDHLDLSLKL